MNNPAYSPYKAVRHQALVAGLRAIYKGTTEVPPLAQIEPPPHVQLILSDLCNFNCRMCAYRTPGYSSSQKFYTITDGKGASLVRDRKHPERNYNPKRWIPTQRALDLVDELAAVGVKAIQLTGGGEPTVHPDFKQVAERIAMQDMEYAIVSNGALIQQRKLVNTFARATWVRLSIDAGVPRTYAKTKGVPDKTMFQVLDSISRIREARDKTGSDCIIGVGFVVTPDNWQEIAEATDLAKRAGADNIRISAQFSPEGAELFRAFYDAARRQCQVARALASDSFTVFDRFGDRVEDLELATPDYDRCCYQHFTTYIGADLNVYRCCVYAYNDRGLIGNLRGRTFEDLWFSEERLADQLGLNPRECERCQFNGINRFLNYLTDPVDPPHCNFV